MESGPELLRTVLDFISRGFNSTDDKEFDSLALAAFAHQFAHNEPYRRYCERRGATPDGVSAWAEIPAVPTAAFKQEEAPLVCGSPKEAEIVFRTSGTSQGAGKRGAHHIRDLSLYRAAALPNFRRHVLPDRTRLPMLILGPAPERAPDSSLAWMLDLVRQEYGDERSAFYMSDGGLEIEPLIRALDESEARGRPVCLLGTAAAFAHLLDALDDRGRVFRLPPGSRIMETGGFKVRETEVPREAFYEWLTSRFGVWPHYCVAEYGMTEMSSQFYDNVLFERARGRSPRTRAKIAPPWVRTQVVDAETLEPLPEGRLGVLRHFDLANLDSVCAIQTDDLGVLGGPGFEILGRAVGSELRGCSLAIDEWLASQ